MGCISNRGHPVRNMMRKSECAKRDAVGGPEDREHEDMYCIEEGSLVFVEIGNIAASELQTFHREDAHA